MPTAVLGVCGFDSLLGRIVASSRAMCCRCPSRALVLASQSLLMEAFFYVFLQQCQIHPPSATFPLSRTSSPAALAAVSLARTLTALFCSARSRSALPFSRGLRVWRPRFGGSWPFSPCLRVAVSRTPCCYVWDEISSENNRSGCAILRSYGSKLYRVYNAQDLPRLPSRACLFLSGTALSTLPAAPAVYSQEKTPLFLLSRKLQTCLIVTDG